MKSATRDPRLRDVTSTDEGPLAELERLFKEIPANTAAMDQLMNELKDLGRKLPPELMQPPEGLLLENPDWVRGMIREIKPMLMDRLQD